MHQINYIIVDDEYLARTLIKEYADQFGHLRLIASCSSGAEALEALEHGDVHLVFLDIQMPDIKGIELVKSFQVEPLIVFVTAYDQYAVESYDLKALDYLLKPVEFERFVKTIYKVEEHLKHTASSRGGHIFVRANGALNKVYYKDILYIEGLNEYVIIHTSDSRKKIVTLMSLVNLEEVLPENFLRIHKSYIVNKNNVSSLSGSQLTLNNVEIPIGRTYKKKTLETIFR